MHLKTYIFEHPTENKVRALTRRSYIYAGLFGSLYVLFQGFPGRFLLALMVDTFFIALGALAAVALIANMAARDASVIFVFLVIAVMGARARPMIVIVKNAYANRGWFVTPI